MVWRVLLTVVVVIGVAFGAFYAWAWNSEIPPTNAPAYLFDPGIVAKGAQLAAVGNCGICHTQAGAKPYAGGFPVQTPFGTIYGTNITPDPDTGIGTWSETAFRRALHEGVDRTGNHLYPAFPYDHFTHATDGDISALYAFLMTREPVAKANRTPGVPFPLNVRLFAAGWKLLFLHKGQIPPDASKSAEWNRGEYLAESLGHCGACHTPRNVLGAEKRDGHFAGGQSEGWLAPALNAASPAPVSWTAEQVYAYLRNGFAKQHGLTAGPMQPVVRNLKKAPDSDLRAIATYVASLAGSQNDAQREQETQKALDFARSRGSKVPMPPSGVITTSTRADAEPGRTNDDSAAPSGAVIFAGACASCHHSGGELPVSRPIELGLSTPVNAPDPAALLRIVLDGIHPSSGERGPIMPGFSGALTDPQITALVSHVRSQFSRQPAWPNIAAALTKVRQNKEPATEAP
jgi:mono/diheme cytochrome c family protein